MRNLLFPVALAIVVAGCGTAVKTNTASDTLPHAAGQFALKNVSDVQGESYVLGSGRRVYRGNVSFTLPHSQVSGTARVMYRATDGHLVFVPGAQGLHVSTHSNGRSTIFVEDQP